MTLREGKSNLPTSLQMNNEISKNLNKATLKQLQKHHCNAILSTTNKTLHLICTTELWMKYSHPWRRQHFQGGLAHAMQPSACWTLQKYKTHDHQSLITMQTIKDALGCKNQISFTRCTTFAHQAISIPCCQIKLYKARSNKGNGLTLLLYKWLKKSMAELDLWWQTGVAKHAKA